VVFPYRSNNERREESVCFWWGKVAKRLKAKTRRGESQTIYWKSSQKTTNDREKNRKLVILCVRLKDL